MAEPSRLLKIVALVALSLATGRAALAQRAPDQTSPAPISGPVDVDDFFPGGIDCTEGCGYSVQLGPGVNASANQVLDWCSTRVVDGANGGVPTYPDFVPVPCDHPDAAPPTAGQPPPTHAEIVAYLCPPIRHSAIGRNPPGEGLTGLETYLWAQPQAPATASGSIRGHPATCTVAPTLWRWDSGDGHDYTADTHGGPHPDNPAGHLYETKGDYWLTLDVTWQRTTTAGADSVVTTTDEPYHVYEVRAVLVEPPG